MFPTISQYAIALEELAGAQPAAEREALVKNFIRFLKQRREKRKLPLILKRMEELADEKAGKKKVTAVTAHEVSGALAKHLAQKAEELFPGKIIDLHFETDPSVIGGVAFKTTEEMRDSTLATALKNFKKEISL